MTFFNDSGLNDFEDTMVNDTIDNGNATTNIEGTIETSKSTFDSVVWLSMDILFLIYSLTILVFVVKKHRHQLEPVHLLTLSAFMNLILCFFELMMYDILSIAWKSPLRNGVSKFFEDTFWLSFLLIVFLEDLNGFFFVRFDVFYYEWITNYRTIVGVIIIEVLAAFIVGMTNWQAAPVTNYYCYLYFTSEIFYISTLPYLLCFITSISVVFYMMYKKYQLSNMVAPQHNITYPQVVTASQHQAPDTSSKITTSRGNSQHASRQVVPMIPGQLQTGKLTPHESISIISLEMDENDQTPKERRQTPKLAWMDPSVPTTSAYVQDQSPITDEDVQTSIERLQSPRLAWMDPSVPTTSAYVQDQPPNTDEDVQEQVGWQDPSLWLQSQCFPPAVQNFLEKIKKYLKAHIYNLVLISFLLPPNVLIAIIKFWDWKCEDWGSFAKNFEFFILIFILPYPYVVKLKLDNFH